MNLKSTLSQLRVLAVLEGISYLLFALTMPLKYMYEIGMPNRIVGMAHGVLFIAYCIWVVLYAQKAKWPLKTTALGLLASLFPFATFIFDAKVLKNETDD